MDSISDTLKNTQLNPTPQDSSMDELTNLISQSSLADDNRKQFYANWKVALDNKDNPSETLIQSIQNSFSIYLREISWDEGPENVRIAKMYIINFLTSQECYRQRMSYALAAYDVINNVIK